MGRGTGGSGDADRDSLTLYAGERTALGVRISPDQDR